MLLGAGPAVGPGLGHLLGRKLGSLGSQLGLLDVQGARLGEGTTLFSQHLGLLGTEQFVADHKSKQFTPSFSPERTQALSDGDSGRLARLQEEESGPERGSDSESHNWLVAGAKAASDSLGQDFCPWGGT